MFKKVVGLVTLVPALALAACAPQNAPSEDAPAVADDGVSIADWASSYGTWSISPFGDYSYYNQQLDTAEWGFTLTDTAHTGATKGAGACLVNQIAGSCTTDAQCGTSPGPGGEWYYCWNNGCYERPGPQSAYCKLGGSWAAGTYYSSNPTYVEGIGYVLGCMTKANGPSANCGSTNTSLYVRTVSGVYAQDCYDIDFQNRVCNQL